MGCSNSRNPELAVVDTFTSQRNSLNSSNNPLILQMIAETKNNFDLNQNNAQVDTINANLLINKETIQVFY